jgi:hypothetical protein
MGCSSGVDLAPFVHWNSFIPPEELSSASFNASPRSKGFSSEPIGIVGGSKSFGATFSGVVVLG